MSEVYIKFHDIDQFYFLDQGKANKCVKDDF